MIQISDSYRIPGKVVVTYILIIICVLSFLVTQDPDYALYGGVIPLEWFAPDQMDAMLAAGRPPIMITLLWSLNLHGSFFHLLMNCLFLYLFGPNVEARLGRARFLLFYISCGAGGFMLHAIFNASSTIPVIGASGAISGLLGAYLFCFSDHFFRIRIRNVHKEYIYPVKTLIIVWLITQIIIAILPVSTQTNTTAYLTHLGGFFCGLILTQPLVKRLGPRFTVFQGGKSKTND